MSCQNRQISLEAEKSSYLYFNELKEYVDLFNFLKNW